MILLADVVPSVNPDPNALPGGNALQVLINGLGFYSLALCVLVIVGGAGAWAVGANTGHVEWATNGKRATMVAFCAAILVGASTVLIKFFYGLGGQVR